MFSRTVACYSLCPPLFPRENEVNVLVTQLYLTLCDPARLLCPWDFPGKNTGVGCYFLLQGIFLTRGLNLGLPHCRQTLFRLIHQERPISQSLLEFMSVDSVRLSNQPSSAASSLFCCPCSVTKLCPTLCYPVDCGTPGFPILHFFPEFAQTHTHLVRDAI